jgi:hypothetical protein
MVNAERLLDGLKKLRSKLEADLRVPLQSLLLAAKGRAGN